MNPSLERQASHRLGMVLRRRWTLEQVIGTGGTAVVYAARHRNGSRVAIKVLHPALCADPAIRNRFLQEGYLANRIGVPDVVKVIDDDIEGDTAYLVMELLEGASVEAVRQRAGGRLAPADVVEIGCRLLAVLEAAHAQGVLHRDIKPANLFRTVDPLGFKVLDFGIAWLVSTQRSFEEEAELGGARFIGTPAFMAPEQARGEPAQLDERTDLWAVGATLFTMLTGQHVHSGRTTSEVLQSARERAAPVLGDQLRSIPAQLTAIVDRALAFDRGARFQSAAEMKLTCEDCRRSLAASGERSRFFGSNGRAESYTARFVADDDAALPAERAAAKSAVVRTASAEPRAGFWSGRVGRLWWFHYTGPCTDETWRQYLEMVQQMIDSGRDSTLVCLAHRADAPSPVQRRHMAEFIEKNREALIRLDRFALVIDSVVHRGAITALNWLVKKPFEERIFNSPLAAIKWLTEHHPELDPEAVRASIVGHVPRHSLWASLESEASETVARSVAQ